MRANLRPLVGVVVLLLVWEAVGRSGLVAGQVVPPPSVVAVAFVHVLGAAGFRSAAGSTVLSWLVAVALATVVGVGLGLVLGSVPALRSASTVVVEFLRPLPGVALIPLVIVVIGTDADGKVALAAFAALWPVLFATLSASGDTDPVLTEVARSYRVATWRTALWVRVPGALPTVLTGVRMATSIALVSLVATEFLTRGRAGLGRFIYVSGSGAGRVDVVLAGVVFTGLLGLLADLLLNGVRRRFVPWAPEGDTA
jgi:NitT/TauT family transport system permease protein